MICGLLGKKLGHSYSPQIQAFLKDYDYKLFEVLPEGLEDFLQNSDFQGINVTIPYKKDVIPHLTTLSDTAKRIGSVNTIVKKADGLHGYNTDHYGFMYMVKSTGTDVNGKKAIVLGSGGASLTVVDVLKSLGAAEVVVISRKGEDNYENISRHYDADIIVNATPVGMYPNNGERLIDLAQFKNCICVLDIVYNPSLTAILLQAEQLGIPFENGLSMLVAQAKRAAELFTDTEIPDSVIPEITQKLGAQMKNIVLIGMPGCGKSSVGKMLAADLNREFYDADEEFERVTGIFPGTYITTYGEAEFRKKEQEILSELCKKSACVISTGGGCVTVPSNYPILHQNSSIVWVRRNTSLLPTNGRPLSQQNSLMDMYIKRAPMYCTFCDEQVKNEISMRDTADKIKRSLKL